MAPNAMGAGDLGISGGTGLRRKVRATSVESDDFDRVLVDSAKTPLIMYDVSVCT